MNLVDIEHDLAFEGKIDAIMKLDSGDIGALAYYLSLGAAVDGLFPNHRSSYRNKASHILNDLRRACESVGGLEYLEKQVEQASLQDERICEAVRSNP